MIQNRFSKSLLICLFQVGSVFFTLSAAGQSQSYRTSELGLGVGGTNYKGEIAPNYRFLNNRPALTVFYKRDVSQPLVLRAGLTLGLMRAHDEDVKRPLNQFRRADMITNLIELAAGIDYNFLNYYDQRQRIRWTPYFFLGAAVANYNNKVVLQDNVIKPFENGFVLSIPMGVGVKYALSRHWNLGLEAAARKTVFKAGDKVDYLKNKNHESTPPDQLPYANPYDNDWYFYNGISISYTFYKLICPDVYKGNKDLLR
jgi:hypothetical protein